MKGQSQKYSAARNMDDTVNRGDSVPTDYPKVCSKHFIEGQTHHFCGNNFGFQLNVSQIKITIDGHHYYHVLRRHLGGIDKQSTCSDREINFLQSRHVLLIKCSPHPSSSRTQTYGKTPATRRSSSPKFRHLCHDKYSCRCRGTTHWARPSDCVYNPF